MPAALVTGAAGFIGSNLADALLDSGYTVYGIDNFVTGREQNLESLRDDADFEFVEADIRDSDALIELARSVSYVFHQAAVPSVPRSIRDPSTTTDANCSGTATVLDVARAADVDKVVVASSSSVYGSTETFPTVETMLTQPASPYALSKYFAEELALQFSELSDIDAVALRYFNVFGPRQDPNGEYAAVIPKFVRRMLNGESPIVYGDGEQSRDFTYVDNVVRANRLAAETDVTGEVFNIASGSRVTINELVAALNDLLDANLEPEYADPRPGDVRHSHGDISKAQDLLGFVPGVSFEEGLARTIDFYRARG